MQQPGGKTGGDSPMQPSDGFRGERPFSQALAARWPCQAERGVGWDAHVDAMLAWCMRVIRVWRSSGSFARANWCGPPWRGRRGGPQCWSVDVS